MENEERYWYTDYCSECNILFKGNMFISICQKNKEHKAIYIDPANRLMIITILEKLGVEFYGK